MPSAVRPEDVAFNRVSVALARSQSLVASWLPPRSTEDEAAQKTPEQLQKEESALFTPGSDMYGLWLCYLQSVAICSQISSLGVGAEPPKDILDGSFKRNQLSSNERLRQQILGKNAAKSRGVQPSDQKSAAAAHLPSKKLERPTKPVRAQDDSDEEEDGRAAMFKSKRKAAPAPVKKEVSKGEESGSEEEAKGRAAPKQANAAAAQAQEKSRKRPVSFLDELLEERTKKKNKKQKAQAEAQVKAAVEEPKDDSREQKSDSATATKQMADEEDSEDGSDKITSKPAPAKVSIQHGDSGAAAIAAESALLDRSDKKKKKKKKKKNKGEATQEP
ncbi:hypothetical protein DBV05_g4246 [Lasiodiplodia theobromae]|uniref:Uncharacterized protein n=1 Tax=Lasiodiplodia theobromae TaxID=45133 RepID=A0A5N5DH28_9PEZI|nr:hypothetical protein DBV05_g4246 [Lasiodiplodia theobromae]